MNKKIAIVITPNWKDYAKDYLRECIAGIRKQDYPGEMKVFITDNETSSESAGLLRSLAPEAELILNNTNDGYAKGCNDSMRQALMQGFDYIAVFNIHTELEPDCLRKMAGALESDARIGAVQARIMMKEEPDLINSIGNTTHFLGFGYCLGYREKWQNQIETVIDIAYPSGSSILFRREALEIVGLFDEEFWMYNEDQEIGWRLWLNGWRVVLMPTAVMYNNYEFQRSIKKYYWMDRNRILTILLCYHFLTLLLILPAFIVMEFGLVLFSFKTGWFKEKKRVWLYFLRLRTWKYIIRSRRRNQELRKVKDAEIIKLIVGRIWYQEVADWKLRLINPIFGLYWRIVSKIIIW